MNLRNDKFVRTIALCWTMMLCLPGLGVGAATPVARQSEPGRTIVAGVGSQALSFESNLGQFEPGVAFVSRGPNYHLSLSPTTVRVMLQKVVTAFPLVNGSPQVFPAPRTVRHRSLLVELQGANQQAQMSGDGAIAGEANYFIGNDPIRWRTGVPTYDRVRVTDVYPGINLLHYGNQHHLEYDFEIAPEVDPGIIAMRFSGADQITIGADGDLVLSLDDEEIRQPKPVIYQTVQGQRKQIPGGYMLTDPQTIKFAIGAYDHKLPLVIDPVMSYWKFINTPDNYDNDYVWAVAIGPDGDVYLAGETMTPGLANTNAYQTNVAGVLQQHGDVFVARRSNDISSRVYYTYLGGSAYEAAFGLAVDAGGNAYVTGYTGSTDFPTNRAVQPKIAGTAPPGFPAPPLDCFIAKIGPYGSNLIFSTYYGGNGSGYNGDGFDVGYGIALATNRDVYVAGYTFSTNFPTVNNTSTNAGSLDDGFVVKLDASGTNVIYAMRLGGTGSDFARDVAVGPDGNPIVIGYTASMNFPVTTNAFQKLLNGTTNASSAHDVFISKIAATNGSIIYSTLVGGANSDQGRRLAMDASGAAYVTGWTLSGDFPRTFTNFPSPVTTTPGIADAFVVKLNPASTNLDYAITFGGSGKDEALDVAVDASGQAHLVGTTESLNFPTNAVFEDLSDSLQGGSDAFLAEVNSNGTAFFYSAYLGGAAVDRGYGVALDTGGNSYFVGEFNKDPFIFKVLVDVSLVIAANGTNVNVSWPGYAAEFVLQASTNLLATNGWQAVSSTSVFTNSRHIVTLPATNAASFFRLTQ